MRKENIIRLMDGGEEKSFKVKQMSATRGERFVFKFVMLLGGEAEIERMTDPYALLGALSSKPFERVQELLDELIGCISRVNGGVETQLINSSRSSCTLSKGLELIAPSNAYGSVKLSTCV